MDHVTKSLNRKKEETPRISRISRMGGDERRQVWI
jgi:hypothetical protein